MSGDTPTARGDRAQRRLDVLEASASILEEGGWAALNMREVARRAGVSAGALYQWFEGKDEIYAELFTQRLTDGAERISTESGSLDLDGVVLSIMRWVHTNWRDLGRWQLDYAEIARSREDGPVRRALAEAHRDLLSAGATQIAAAAEREGAAIDTSPDSMHLIWATATGVAQRAEVLRFDDERSTALMTQASRALVLGLRETN